MSTMTSALLPCGYCSRCGYGGTIGTGSTECLNKRPLNTTPETYPTMRTTRRRPAVTSAPSPAIAGWLAYDPTDRFPFFRTLSDLDDVAEEARDLGVTVAPVSLLEARDKRLQDDGSDAYLDHRVNNAAILSAGAEKRSEIYGLSSDGMENTDEGTWQDFDPSCRYAVVGQHTGGDMEAFVNSMEDRHLTSEDLEENLWQVGQVPSEIWDLEKGTVSRIVRTFAQQDFTPVDGTFTPAQRLAVIVDTYPVHDGEGIPVYNPDRPIVLIEKGSDGGYWITDHVLALDARNYHETQEAPEHWSIHLVIDLRDGSEV